MCHSGHILMNKYILIFFKIVLLLFYFTQEFSAILLIRHSVVLQQMVKRHINTLQKTFIFLFFSD